MEVLLPQRCTPAPTTGGKRGFGSWRPLAAPEHPTSPHLDAGGGASNSPPANADRRAAAGPVTGHRLRGTNRWGSSASGTSAEPGFLHQGLTFELVYPLVVADLPEHVRE
jgi:hypothetical protein